MIKYIFEDKESSGISQLYMAGYRDTSNFIFANGKDNIYNTIFREVPNADTEIIIIMDLVYDNADTVNCYNNLIDKLVSAGYMKFRIFPIVCSEYYVIQLLKELRLMENSPIVDICIAQEDYKNPTIQIQNSKIASSANFERFCKHVLEVMGPKCTRRKNEFYTQDCICTAPMKSCAMKIGLVDKAIRLLKKYPCVPLNPIKKVHEPLNPTKMDDLHRKLIDEYNKKVEEHNESAVQQGRQKTLYVKADYMHIRVKEALRRREVRKARGKQ